MHIRIDYLADKNCFTELNESPRLRRQWQDVLEECRQTEAGPEERLRIALLNVDYVTSFELPFRLLLTRTPQLIAALREEWDISQKNVVFNDKRFGCVYNLKASLSGGPDTFRYHLSHRIRRVVANENTSSPYQLIGPGSESAPSTAEVCAGDRIAGERTGRPVLVRQPAHCGRYPEAEKVRDADCDGFCGRV